MLLGTVPCDFKDFRRWQLATNIRMMDALRQAQVINGNNLASNETRCFGCSWPTFCYQNTQADFAPVLER